MNLSLRWATGGLATAFAFAGSALMQTHYYVITYSIDCEIHGGSKKRVGFLSYKKLEKIKLEDFYLGSIPCLLCTPQLNAALDPDWTFKETSKLEIQLLALDGLELRDLRERSVVGKS
jgi:hypothetical protein